MMHNSLKEAVFGRLLIFALYSFCSSINPCLLVLIFIPENRNEGIHRV